MKESEEDVPELESWINNVPDSISSIILGFKEDIKYLLEEITVDKMRLMSPKELLDFVEKIINFNWWEKQKVDKWFKWTSDFWTFAWWSVSEDWNPNLDNFTLLIKKWKWNIVRLRWWNSRYTCLLK